MPAAGICGMRVRIYIARHSTQRFQLMIGMIGLDSHAQVLQSRACRERVLTRVAYAQKHAREMILSMWGKCCHDSQRSPRTVRPGI